MSLVEVKRGASHRFSIELPIAIAEYHDILIELRSASSDNQLLAKAGYNVEGVAPLTLSESNPKAAIMYIAGSTTAKVSEGVYRIVYIARRVNASYADGYYTESEEAKYLKLY